MAGPETDILVAGGGPAGLAAAAAFAARGFSTLCVDPAPPEGAGTVPGAPEDLRSTAFLRPAIALLGAAGLWARVAPHAAPLRIIRIVDAGGTANRARYRADFAADEVAGREPGEPLGWNVPNAVLRRAFAAGLADLPGASLRRDAFRDIVPRLDHAVVGLASGARVRARLVIAADGRESPLRRALGIGAIRHATGQSALAFTVSAGLPHDGVSTEIHRSGGPFTLVPLPDGAEGPMAAVVWMEEAAEAGRLAGLPVPDFESALNERSLGVLGPLRLAGARTVWPILHLLAHRFDGPRTALAAEAAHVIPPIGAQGLNASLADIACLLDLATRARAAGRDFGAPAVLARYHRTRWPDAALRGAGIGFLNLAARAGAQPLRDLRGAGLRVLHGLPPLRRLAMRAGLGG